MDFKNLSVFNAASQNLQYLSARQKVLAENIANVNTPGYLARDVAVFTPEKPSFALQTTNPKHMSLKSQNSQSWLQIITPNPKQALTIDGNGIVLEDQMNQASKVSGEYKKIITIFNKYKTLLQTANTKINA